MNRSGAEATGEAGENRRGAKDTKKGLNTEDTERTEGTEEKSGLLCALCGKTRSPFASSAILPGFSRRPGCFVFRKGGYAWRQQGINSR